MKGSPGLEIHITSDSSATYIQVSYGQTTMNERFIYVSEDLVVGSDPEFFTELAALIKDNDMISAALDQIAKAAVQIEEARHDYGPDYFQ